METPSPGTGSGLVSSTMLLATLVLGTCGSAVAQDFGATSSLRLVSGTLNGQAITPASRSVTVAPGASLVGSLTVQINSTFPSNAVMVIGATPTWGPHASSYITVGWFSTPTTGLTRSVNVNWQAPTSPGTYYIVAAFNGEFSADEVLSCANWSTGAVVWNDGNDVADWSSSTITQIISFQLAPMPRFL